MGAGRADRRGQRRDAAGPAVRGCRILAGIVSVLTTGTSWNALPQELGCGSGVTCWRRLREWQRAGVWQRLHRLVLDQLGQRGLLDWSRAAVDSVSVRAKRKGELTGPIPTDRGKAGTKYHVLCDRNGLPQRTCPSPVSTSGHGIGCGSAGARSAVRRPRWSTNQSRASAAACSSVPGSSNRWVAPGTTASRDSHRNPGLRPPVELEHHGVPAADHQQGRRPYRAQPRRRQVGAAPAGDDRGHLRVVGGRPERRRRAGAGPEVPDRQAPAPAAVPHPGRHRGQPTGQQPDVEHVPAVELLARGEQVEQQRGQPGLLQHVPAT